VSSADAWISPRHSCSVSVSLSVSIPLSLSIYLRLINPFKVSLSLSLYLSFYLSIIKGSGRNGKESKTRLTMKFQFTAWCVAGSTGFMAGLSF